MYSAKSFLITEKEFNYLLPVLRRKMSQTGDRFSIIADNIDDLTDILNRLKGLYDYYNDLHSMTAYYCSKIGSLNYFRDLVGYNTPKPKKESFEEILKSDHPLLKI